MYMKFLASAESDRDINFLSTPNRFGRTLYAILRYLLGGMRLICSSPPYLNSKANILSAWLFFIVNCSFHKISNFWASQALLPLWVADGFLLED